MGLALWLEGCPFVASRGPAHRAMSYEPFSRMAGAAPRAARSLRGHFVGMLSGLRCCLAPGDSGHLLEFLGVPVEGGVATTDGLSASLKPDLQNCRQDDLAVTGAL